MNIIDYYCGLGHFIIYHEHNTVVNLFRLYGLEEFNGQRPSQHFSVSYLTI